jgi:ABC-type spermidine/putrescine transport system permease subunit II
MIKKGVTPKINAVSTLMLVVSLSLVVVSILLSRRSGGDDSVQMGF